MSMVNENINININNNSCDNGNNDITEISNNITQLYKLSFTDKENTNKIIINKPCYKINPTSFKSSIDSKILSYKKTDRSSFLDVYVNHCIGLASRSPDPSTKVGCVIINTNCDLVSQGYNGELLYDKPRDTKFDLNMINFKQLYENVFKDSDSFLKRDDAAKLFLYDKVIVELHNHESAEDCDIKHDEISVHIAIEKNLYNAYKKDQAYKKNPETMNPPTPEELALLNKEVCSEGIDKTIHAEANAIKGAIASIPSGCIAIVSLMPCPQCYKLLAETGIKWVIVLSDSGRYCNTLHSLLMPNKPKVILFSQIKEYMSDQHFATNKVFKSTLAKFFPINDQPIEKEVLHICNKSDRFNCNYNAISIDYHPHDTIIEELLSILFRL